MFLFAGLNIKPAVKYTRLAIGKTLINNNSTPSPRQFSTLKEIFSTYGRNPPIRDTRYACEAIATKEMHHNTGKKCGGILLGGLNFSSLVFTFDNNLFSIDDINTPTKI